MKPRLVFIFLLIVLVPLAVSAWLGVRVARGEREMVRHRFRELAIARLQDVRADVAALVAAREREFLADPDLSTLPVESLRRKTRQSVFARQYFVLDHEGALRYPMPPDLVRHFYPLDAGARPDMASRVFVLNEPGPDTSLAATDHERQFFIEDDNGELVPSPQPNLNKSERRFVESTRGIWPDLPIPSADFASNVMPTADEAQRAVVPQTEPVGKGGQAQQTEKWVKGRSTPEGTPIGKGGSAQQTAKGAGAKSIPQAAAPYKGWHTWYWGDGLNVILWWRDKAGAVVGAHLNEARLMADIVGLLPETNPEEQTGAPSRIALLDADADTIYQWGVYQPADDEAPLAELALHTPLSSWKLAYFGSNDVASGALGGGVLFNLLAGLALVGAMVVGLAVYYYRESSREMREATQRVSFVNQVSHELKTPLTSIRMYAEMLNGELDETDAPARRRLDVIVSESQRLSRLIGNVLTFGRKQRSALSLHRAPGCVDDVVRSVLAHFETPLSAKGIAIEFAPGAADTAQFDRDALEQILGNLLNNVEKYAVDADRVAITSQQDGDVVSITVADSGPGVPGGEEEKVFRPFYRVSDRLTDGVAGTGIGLAIARDLARLHGGDLTLEPAQLGACFRLTIHAPRYGTGESV